MNRYEVGDSHCGFLAYEADLRSAFKQALAYQTTSHKACIVTVFDRLAHHGKPDIWGYAKAAGLWGVVLHTRSSATIDIPSPQAQ